MYNGVGGSSLHYTAVWLRLRPSDFRRGSEHGLAPDWPISYWDLAPYYDRADDVIGISGLAGDPAYPARPPRPCPPLPLGGTGRAAARGLRKLGWHHWPLELAVLSRDRGGRPACNHCGGCQAGCPRGSLGSSSVTWWPRALRDGAVLRSGVLAERILRDGRGRACGIQCLDSASGSRSVVHADRVVICANGIGTPRLLLLSDLPDRSDQTGRNLMHHGLAVIEAWLPDIVGSHQGAVGGALYTAEFAEPTAASGDVSTDSPWSPARD
ncbi:MAG: GMC family oxidoreductase N-terminal domain-containing protein [Solirubrobacterales bacterium]